MIAVLPGTTGTRTPPPRSARQNSALMTVAHMPDLRIFVLGYVAFSACTPVRTSDVSDPVVGTAETIVKSEPHDTHNGTDTVDLSDSTAIAPDTHSPRTILERSLIDPLTAQSCRPTMNGRKARRRTSPYSQ